MITDASGQTSTKPINLRVNSTLSVATSILPAIRSAEGYSFALTATGGQPPYTWSLSGASLPSGISEGDDWASRAKGLLGSHNQQLDEVVFDWLNGIAENGIAGANKEDTIALCRHYDGVNDMLPEDIFDFTVEVADELGIEDEELA